MAVLLIKMSNVRRYLSERYPWLNLTYLLVAASAIALLLVAIWPHSQLIADLVVLTAIPGILGAILWGMTFWAKARVQIGRRKLRYKSVRRIGGLAALFCLPFLFLQQASIYLRGPKILPGPAPELNRTSGQRRGDEQHPSLDGSAGVCIKLNATGGVEAAKIMNSSGDPKIDQAILQAASQLTWDKPYPKPGWVGIRLDIGSGTSDGRPGPSCQSIVGQPS